MLLGITGTADPHLRLLAATYLIEAHKFIGAQFYPSPRPNWDRTLDGFAAKGIDVVVLEVRTDAEASVIHRRAGHLLYLGGWGRFEANLSLPPGDVELLPCNSSTTLFRQLDSVVGNLAFSGTVQ